MSKKIVSFGEIMLRLNPPGYLRIQQTDSFMASYAGGEANVAVSLANYGESAAFVTMVPANDIGQSAVNSLRHWGVDVSFIVKGGERLGVYFVEKGASQRASKVIYDRKHSSVAESSFNDFDWNAIFNDADWFHFTGITPALSDNTADLCLKVCKMAKKKGITVSCDLNYRKNLWSREKAKGVMSAIMPFVDVVIGNEEDAYDVFGFKAGDTNVIDGKLNRDGYRDVAHMITDSFGCSKVAFTLRESISANDNNWAGMLFDGNDCYFSKKYPIHIVDRVGGGDSFSGALIYALHNNFPSDQAIEFAVAASCLKHTIEYDFNHVTLDEVRNLMGGDGSGRVQR